MRRMLCTAGLLLAAAWTGAFDEPHKYFQNFSGSGPLQDQDYFPIGVWAQPTGSINAYKDMGINLYVTGEGSATFALSCKLYEMPVIMHQSADLLSRLALFQDYLIGWGQQDEPDNAQAAPGGGYDPCITEAELLSRYNAMQTADADRPVYLNFGRGASDLNWIGRGTCTGNWQMYPGYCNAGDFVCFDIYPVNDGNPGDLWYVPKGVDSLHSWSGNAKPVWTYIECTDISDGSGGKPSIAQVKSEIWMSIVHGANAILYFCHSFVTGSSNDDALLDDAFMVAGLTDVNARITSLASVLNSPTVTGKVTCSAANVDILVKEYGGGMYIFTAEMTGASASPTFTVTGAPATEVTVLDEERSLTISGNSFSDPMGAYGVHLYQIGGTPVNDVVPVSRNLPVPAAYLTANPLRDNTEIFFTNTNGSADLSATVVSLTGQPVRSLEVTGGKTAWDGKNAHGQRVPAGMYQIIVNDGKAAGMVPVMVVE